jgi:hypothetical protein
MAKLSYCGQCEASPTICPKRCPNLLKLPLCCLKLSVNKVALVSFKLHKVVVTFN